MSACVGTRCMSGTTSETSTSQSLRPSCAFCCRQYKYGWKTLIESDTLPPGLNEDVVRAISAKKNEPDWLLDFRLKAYRRWLTMVEPNWSDNRYPALDYQSISYYSAPKQQEKKKSLDELDPELLRTFERLNIPINEQKRLGNVAVDAVFDSTSIATTFRKELAEVIDLLVEPSIDFGDSRLPQTKVHVPFNNELRTS